jgi:hypothetical protein
MTFINPMRAAPRTPHRTFMTRIVLGKEEERRKKEEERNKKVLVLPSSFFLPPSSFI